MLLPWPPCMSPSQQVQLMPLMTLYIFLAPHLVLASSEWAPTDFVLISLFSSAHCTSLASCPGSSCSGKAHTAPCTGPWECRGVNISAGTSSRGIQELMDQDFCSQGMFGGGLSICSINIPVGSIAPSMTSLINYSCFGFSFSWSLALVPCA